jgi:hypothetical protein
VSRCRSCGAPIRWTRTEKGRRMPIDPEPVPEGNIVLRELDEATPLALSVPPAAFPDEPRYLSHFATCPDAAKHRRRSAA